MLLNRFIIAIYLFFGIFHFSIFAIASHFDEFRDQVVLLEYKSSKKYLHVDKDASNLALTSLDSVEAANPYSMWYVEYQDDKNFALYSLKQKKYLKSTSASSINLGSNRGEDTHWIVSAIASSTGFKYLFQNKKNKLFLKGSKEDDTVSMSIEPDKWRVHHSYYYPYYKLEGFLHDFTYESYKNEDYLENLFQNYGATVYAGDATFELDESSVGSRVQHSYEKIHTENFAWGLSQALGLGIAVKAAIKIPLFGGVEETTTANIILDSHQDWTKEESKSVSYVAWITPNSAGVYRMSSTLEMLENATMPFSAKARFQAQAIDKHKNLIPGQFAPSLIIKKFLEKAGCTYDLEGASANDDTSITIDIKGNMTATYALRSITTIKKIN